jgi:hypothetical protein
VAKRDVDTQGVFKVLYWDILLGGNPSVTSAPQVWDQRPKRSVYWVQTSRPRSPRTRLTTVRRSVLQPRPFAAVIAIARV